MLKKRSEMLSFRCPKDIQTELDEFATKQDRNRSEVIMDIIKTFFESGAAADAAAFSLNKRAAYLISLLALSEVAISQDAMNFIKQEAKDIWTNMKKQ